MTNPQAQAGPFEGILNFELFTGAVLRDIGAMDFDGVGDLDLPLMATQLEQALGKVRAEITRRGTS